MRNDPPWERYTYACALCKTRVPKDDMYRVELDAPGGFDWICEGCHDQTSEDYGGEIAEKNQP